MAGTGPCYMSLDLELLRVLTAGDAAALQELLRRREDQTSGHVAVNVQATAPTDALAAQPCPGTSCLLGVTSNGNTALHLVASRGHADLAVLICERTPSLAATRNTFLDTPLHCAAREGHREAAACLMATMRAGGRAGELAEALRARNCLSATALYEAVRHRCAGVVELLMTEAPELASVETEDGSSPLYLAASIHSQELVRTLLRASPDGTPSPASFSGPEGLTALHAAAAASSHEMAQEILSWKPQGPTLLTRVDSTGRTPLHVAVMYGRLRTVQLFLDDITSAEQVCIRNNHGLFPVHTAAICPGYYGRAETLFKKCPGYHGRAIIQTLFKKRPGYYGRAIIETLFKKCPGYYKMVDDKGRNLLHCAVEHNSYWVVRFICQKYTIATLLNGADYEGNTPLHLAVKYGFIRIVSILLETMSVDMNIVNKDGLTAGDLARAAALRPWEDYTWSPNSIVSFCLACCGDEISPYRVDSIREPPVEEKTDNSKSVHPLLADKKPTKEQASSDKEEEDLSKTGTIGSVLIATVAFAAAFTVPGGVVADDRPGSGAAVMARRFAFRAFVVSDAMAFFCSILATIYLIYGGTKQAPRARRVLHRMHASMLLPLSGLFTIAAFPFGFHLVLGNANRGLIVFVYMVSSASILCSILDFWTASLYGMVRAAWRRAGCCGVTGVLLSIYVAAPLFLVLICAAFALAVALDIALPNY